MGAHETQDLTYDQEARKRWGVYIVAILCMVALLAVMVVAYRGHDKTDEALAKADALNKTFVAAGIPAVDRDQLAGTLGTDGGAICDTAHSDLGKAALKNGLVNGATGPGGRGVTVARNTLVGEHLVVALYCPENLTKFDKIVAGLKFADVVKD
jgi:hypothetical protein